MTTGQLVKFLVENGTQDMEVAIHLRNEKGWAVMQIEGYGVAERVEKEKGEIVPSVLISASLPDLEDPEQLVPWKEGEGPNQQKKEEENGQDE